jgi:hypothetical protein
MLRHSCGYQHRRRANASSRCSAQAGPNRVIPGGSSLASATPCCEEIWARSAVRREHARPGGRFFAWPPSIKMLCAPMSGCDGHRSNETRRTDSGRASR